MNISGTFYGSDKTDNPVVYTHDVAYAERGDKKLYLQVLTPANPNELRHYDPKDPKSKNPQTMPNDKRRFPLIVYVPGSGWSGTTGYNHLPQLVALSRRGFVVASIEYRGVFSDQIDYLEIARDAREALRFMRGNADRFLVDVDRAGFFGDSSGGQTSLYAALAGKDPVLDQGSYMDQRVDVKACALFYAPVDFSNLLNDRLIEKKPLRPGEADYPNELHELTYLEDVGDKEAFLLGASPIRFVEGAKDLPALLYLIGEEDQWIPMEQGLRLSDKFRENGSRAEFWKVAGAMHVRGCWSDAIVEMLGDFFATAL